METLAAIRSRKSTRAFLPTPVPKDVICQLLEASRWAPSGSNRQPWRVTVVTGPTREALAKRLVQEARAHQGTESAKAESRSAEVRQREGLRADLRRIAEEMGVSMREFVIEGSYAFYDAPVVVFVSYMGPRAGGTVDTSAFVTTMLLAAHDLGLATCWLGYPLSFGEIIREALDLPDDEKLAAVVALGYPDPASPAYEYRSPRAGVDTFVRWVGFDS